MVVQTRKRKVAQEQAAEKAIETPSTSVTPKRQKLPVRSKDDESPAQTAAGKGTLITFDDNGKADKTLRVAAATRKSAAPKGQEVEASEDSDDDAAPEAVSTAKAASDIKKSTQAAQKAAREYVTLFIMIHPNGKHLTAPLDKPRRRSGSVKSATPS